MGSKVTETYSELSCGKTGRGREGWAGKRKWKRRDDKCGLEKQHGERKTTVNGNMEMGAKDKKSQSTKSKRREQQCDFQKEERGGKEGAAIQSQRLWQFRPCVYMLWLVVCK